MRPTLASLTAAGNTPWINPNYIQGSFGLTLTGIISTGATLTYKFQLCYDDPTLRRPVSITQAATTATVTDPNHMLSVGDSVIVAGSGSVKLDGVWDVASVTNQNVYTYTTTISGSDVSVPNTTATNLRVFDDAVVTAATTRQKAAYIGNPIQLVRAKITAYTSGQLDFVVLPAGT